MQTLSYIIISLTALVLVFIVLIRLYKKSEHLRNMAEFYCDTHWEKEREEGVYCRVRMKEDPFYDKRHVREDEFNREINCIIKRFKKKPELLKDTEKSYYERQQLNAKIEESERKRLVIKRVYAYDYEEMLYQIYKPTAKEELGMWRTGEISRDEIIQRIADIKSISSKEAEELFKTLVDHDLIWCSGCKYDLTPMLLYENSEWDIISSSDMNFQKWMKKTD